MQKRERSFGYSIPFQERAARAAPCPIAVLPIGRDTRRLPAEGGHTSSTSASFMSPWTRASLLWIPELADRAKGSAREEPLTFVWGSRTNGRREGTTHLRLPP